MVSVAIGTWAVELVRVGGDVESAGDYPDEASAKSRARLAWHHDRRHLSEIRMVASDGELVSLWVRPVAVSSVPPGYYAVEGKRYTVSRREDGKWAGWTFLATGSDYHDRKGIGSWRPSGEPATSVGDVGAAVMGAICAAPLDRMREYGQITGQCGRCGKKLEDAESRRIGLGPICRSKGF